MTAPRTHSRASNFQIPFNEERVNAQRQIFAVNLRRKKRNEIHWQRRSGGGSQTRVSVEADPSLDADLAAALRADCRKTVLANIRTTLSAQAPVPVLSETISALLECLSDPDEQLHEDAAWILCNLASYSGQQISQLIDRGYLDYALTHLKTCKSVMTESLIWGLGNIAAESEECQQLLVNKGLLDVCLKTLRDTPATQLGLAFVTFWTLKHLVRGNSELTRPQLTNLMETLRGHTLDQLSPELPMVLDLLFAATVNSPTGQEVFLECGLLQLVDGSLEMVPLSCIKIYGNLVAGDLKTTQTMLAAGILETLQQLILDASEEIRTEAYWAINNITAAGPQTIVSVLEHPVLSQCFSGLQDEDEGVRLEASWVFANIAVIGESSSRVRLAELGILQHIVAALRRFNTDLDYTTNLLNTCEGIITSGADVTSYFTETGCFDLLESLQLPSKVTESLFESIEDYFERQNESLHED